MKECVVRADTNTNSRLPLFLLKHKKNKSIQTLIMQLHYPCTQHIHFRSHSFKHVQAYTYSTTLPSNNTLPPKQKCLPLWERKEKKNNTTITLHGITYILANISADSHQRSFKGALGRTRVSSLTITYSWGLTSTATPYGWERTGRGWGGGMGTYVLPPTRYTVTTRMTLH